MMCCQPRQPVCLVTHSVAQTITVSCHSPLCRSLMKLSLIQTSGTSSASGHRKKCSNYLAVPAGDKTRNTWAHGATFFISNLLIWAATCSKVYKLDSVGESVVSGALELWPHGNRQYVFCWWRPWDMAGPIQASEPTSLQGNTLY